MFLMQQKANYIARRKYPELHFLRIHWTSRLLAVIKAFVISVCPGFNLVILYTLIMKERQIIEETIEESIEKYDEQQKREDEQLKQSIADTVTKIKEEQDNV
jgi:hypothetical protein